MKKRYLLPLYLLLIIITISGCEEESLLISLDEEEVFGDEYYDEENGDGLFLYENPFVSFYNNNSSGEFALKSTIKTSEFQFSMLGQPNADQYDFSFDKVYFFSINDGSETVILIDENYEPAFVYFKEPFNDMFLGSLMEFEPIDDNQFYLRLYRYHAESHLATILFETIIFMDENDYYSNPTFALANLEYQGGRIAANKGQDSAFRSPIARLKRLSMTSSTNQRKAASSLSEGISGFNMNVKAFYQSKITQWLISNAEVDSYQVLDKMGLLGSVQGYSEIYSQDTFFRLQFLSYYMKSMNPEMLVDLYDDMIASAPNLTSSQWIETSSMIIGYFTDLENIDMYEHWLNNNGAPDFQSLFEKMNERQLFLSPGKKERLSAANGNLQVGLVWGNSEADLDLWLVDPTGDTVNVAHPNSPSGAFLDRDDSQGIGRENISWISEAPDGDYSIFVKYAGCNNQNCGVVFNVVYVTDGLGNEIRYDVNSKNLGELVIAGQFEKTASTIIKIQ